MNSFGGPTITNANLMTLDEIRALMQDTNNPTVERLIFVETRKSRNVERKVFPCYPLWYDEANKVLTIAAVQCMKNNYFFTYVKISDEMVGKICRFWSMPPSETLMDMNPLEPVDAEERPEVVDPVTDIPKEEDPVQ